MKRINSRLTRDVELCKTKLFNKLGDNIQSNLRWSLIVLLHDDLWNNLLNSLSLAIGRNYEKYH